MRNCVFWAGLLITATVYGQSIVTPVFVHKDGEASAIGYTGSQKEILVDGGLQQIVGWITFQMQGIDVSGVNSAKLILYVKTLDAPGTLGVYALNSRITFPENNLPLGLLPINNIPKLSVALDTADVEKVVQMDITNLVVGGAFNGVALKSTDGLTVTFDSKEGNLAPVILLTYDIGSAAVKWLSGKDAPGTTTGKDGDFYLQSVTGDIYAKVSGAWIITGNLKGPKGDKGTQGEPGISNWVYITASMAPQVSTPQYVSGTALCPPGTKVLSGGWDSGDYSLVDLENVIVLQNRPSSATGDGWYVLIRDPGSSQGNNNFKVCAICASVQ